MNRVERFTWFHTGGQIRIAVAAKQSWEVPQIPASRFQVAVGSSHSGNPPAGSGVRMRQRSTLAPLGPYLQVVRLKQHCLRLKDTSRSSDRADPRVGIFGPKQVGPADAPGKESEQPIRGRPTPMAWRPSGETRFMRWPWKKHRRARLRRRPQLEFLDDRCLLSTGGAIKMIDTRPWPHSNAGMRTSGTFTSE